MYQSVPLSILTYSQSSRLVHVKDEKEQLKSFTPQLQGLSLIGWVGGQLVSGHTLERWEVQGDFWDFYFPSPLIFSLAYTGFPFLTGSTQKVLSVKLPSKSLQKSPKCQNLFTDWHL